MGILVPDQPDKLTPAHPRHDDVGEQEVDLRPFLLEDRERMATVLSRDYAISFPLQRSAEDVDECGFILARRVLLSETSYHSRSERNPGASAPTLTADVLRKP